MGFTAGEGISFSASQARSLLSSPAAGALGAILLSRCLGF